MTDHNGHILELRDVSKSFEGLRALDNVSFALKKGQIKALIGPNGAGKSTLLNVVNGSFGPDSGRILLSGRDIAGFDADRVARLGVSRTFQLIRLFTVNEATALDNVMIGAHQRLKPSLLEAIFRRMKISRQVRAQRSKALEALAFVGLAGLEDSPAAALSFGNQRLLELARALMTEPRVLLLDEPASGLNDAEVDGFMKLLLAIRDRGITILLVEHNMKVVMNIAEEIVVLDFGERLAEGTPAQISSDPAVVEAYLGVKQTQGESGR